MANALAPMTPRQLNLAAKRYVSAQTAPVLAQINAEFAQRARAGSAAIQSSTAALAAALAPQAGQVHSIYANAQAAQNTQDAALANYLQAAGQSLGANVGGQLASAGQTPLHDLAGTGAGAAAASYGMGSAALSRLIAEGAARENYAAGLPGIARLGGAQQASNLGMQLESGREKAVGDLRSKIPGLTADIQNQLNAQNYQKALAAQSGLYDAKKLNQAANIAATKNQTQRDIAAAKINPKTGNPYTYDAAVARINATGKRQNRTYNAGLSRAAGHAVDGLGRPIINPKTGKPYPYVEPPHGSKNSNGKIDGYTPSQRSKFQSVAIETAKDYKHGYHDKNNQYIPPGAGQAKASPLGLYNLLRRHGIPKDIAFSATGQVYGKWLKPGQAKTLG